MTVSIDSLKKLRQITKAGVMDCRQALEETGNNINKAKQWLLKKGVLTAAKKADRETKAGIIEAYVHTGGRMAALVKLTTETDFAAGNKEFKKLAHELCMQVAAMDPQSPADLLQQEYIKDPKKKISDLIKETIARLKENIKVEEIARLQV